MTQACGYDVWDVSVLQNDHITNQVISIDGGIHPR